MSFQTGHLSCALILIKKAIPDRDKINHLGVYNSVKKTKAATAPSAGARHARCPASFYSSTSCGLCNAWF